MTGHETTTFQQQRLREAVIELSLADSWWDARAEWDVDDMHDNKADLSSAGGDQQSLDADCVCGQTGLRYEFTISNRLTGATLSPIGSECINQFGRGDMDAEVRVQRQLFELEQLVTDHVPLELKHFSRASLSKLHDLGALDSWSYELLRDMFNRRSDITPRQSEAVDRVLRRGSGSVRRFLADRARSRAPDIPPAPGIPPPPPNWLQTEPTIEEKNP